MSQTMTYLVGMVLLIIACFVSADEPIFALKIKEHLFYPSELEIPAHKKIKLLVVNEDPTPEEFESYKLNRKKIILGNKKVVIFVGPLQPGEYPFFGGFNILITQGKLIAK